MKTNNNCYAFVDRVFTEPKENHKELPWIEYKDIPLESTKYTWEYFGREMYGRYAVCESNKVKRKLTMGEFYGTSSVD